VTVVPSTEPVLSVDGVSKTFPGQRALVDVSLSVEPGEVHGLIGQNGSGKSTLIKVLAGYHAPDPGGRVLVAGTELQFSAPQESRRLGLRFMHQHLGVIDELSVVENVALVSGYAVHGSRRIAWERQREKARSLLTQLGVDLDVDRLAGKCAPVERTAIAIARALDDEGGDPIRVLVLDEPTAALPPAEVERLFDVVDQVRARKMGVIYVSHRLDEIESLAHRVSVLRDGRLQGTFEIAQIDKSRLVEVMVGERVEMSSRTPRSVTKSPTTAHAVLEVAELRGGNLRAASFEARAGEILGFAGLAGSGGEDAVRALVGAIPARAERVCVDGQVLARQAPRDALAAGLVLVPANRQQGSAVHEFVVRENVTLPSLPRYRDNGRISKEREVLDVLDWIERLQVQPADSEHAFGHLSGGNQQKISLGKWLNTKPTVIALADPTAGVDIKAREAIYDIIRSIAAAGQAIVVSSIDVEDLVALSDRVLVFRDGHIVDELQGDAITEKALLHSMMREFTARDPAPPAEAIGS
jgi:ribose transport system ATP-binding protein